MIQLHINKERCILIILFKRFFCSQKIWLFVCMILATSLYAQDTRIKEELNSPPPEIPLKYALGEKAYNEAINSKKYYYTGNTKCRLCHRKFFIGRKKDPHDFTMERLLETGHQVNAQCLPCHTTGYDVPSGFVNLNETPKLANVQCEGCHGPGNVHINIARKTKKGGGLLVGVDSSNRLKKMCKSCHTDRWDKSYKNFHEAYIKYQNADPNQQTKNKMKNEK